MSAKTAWGLLDLSPQEASPTLDVDPNGASLVLLGADPVGNRSRAIGDPEPVTSDGQDPAATPGA
jgi:hypothetical protein